MYKLCVCHRALLRGHSIPESRRDELEAGVAEYWECAPDNLTPEMIQDAAQIDTRSERCEREGREVKGTMGPL